MKRFNTVNIKDTFDRITNLIFDMTDKASRDGYGGFRKDSLGRVNSSFFSFVFLCGGNRDTHYSRKTLTNVLAKNPEIKIIISEDLSIYKGQLDLLTFEAVLEAVSKMILIPVESYGTACELGAFTRMIESDNKVVAILNKKHSSDNSFINYGPIEYLKNIGDDRVYTASYYEKFGKSYLRLNSNIKKLNEHSLLLKENKICKYFGELNGDIVSVVDLFSFFVAVIDLACLVGFVDIDFIISFFCKITGATKIKLKTDKIDCDELRFRDVLLSLLNILCSIGFMKREGDLYIVEASKLVMDNAKTGERWMGKILFTVSFTRTDEYLNIKSTCQDYKRKIEQYGYY